jgi:phosphoglycolate phosphatase-like HAD superfamily hydrolase
MTNPAQPLLDFAPTKDFFIGIDSDGCAFDSMEIKQKECFTPNSIKFFGLQAISKYAREALEFVNLYSQWRGINRFPAVTKALDLLEKRVEVRDRHFQVPGMPALRAWIEHEPKPANPALEKAVQAASDGAKAELQLVMDWSRAVNATVADIVKGVPPFPFVRECMDKASEKADLIVVSATPGEALEREWVEHDLAGHVAVIAGQEMGKKAEHLKMAAVGKYPSDRILMIGDAPGDLSAARANDVLFYPIMPGNEDASWKQLLDDAMDRFFSGTYKGAYEDDLVKRFLASLPSTPPWKEVE